MKKNNKPFFSIVLPIYNVEKYIDRCINSIINQSFQDFEIILVDDGSTDNCPKICDDWSSKDKRIKIVHKKNEGLGYARNTGLENCCGEYVWFIDSDDYIKPGALSIIYDNICKYGHNDAIFFGFSRVSKNNKVGFTLIPSVPCNFYDNSDIIKNEIFPYFLAQNPIDGKTYNIRISAWSCCLSIDFLKSNDLKFVSEREYISEDVYFFIDMFNKLKSISFINDDLYYYCLNNGSLTFTYRPDRYKRIKEFHEAAQKKCQELNYNEDTLARLNDQFLSNILGCLKMSAGSALKKGLKYSYNEFKNICSDEYLFNIMKKTNLEKHGIYWRTLKKEILRRRYHKIYLMSLFIYLYKGI